MEGNLVAEVGTVILDMLALYTQQFKVTVILHLLQLFYIIVRKLHAVCIQCTLIDKSTLFRYSVLLSIQSTLDLYSLNCICILYIVISLNTLWLQTLLMLREGDNPLMRSVFDLHLVFLRMNQSEQTLKHCFGLIRMFIIKVRVNVNVTRRFCDKIRQKRVHLCYNMLLWKNTTRNNC